MSNHDRHGQHMQKLAAAEAASPSSREWWCATDYTWPAAAVGKVAPAAALVASEKDLTDRCTGGHVAAEHRRARDAPSSRSAAGSRCGAVLDPRRWRY